MGQIRYPSQRPRPRTDCRYGRYILTFPDRRGESRMAMSCRINEIGTSLAEQSGEGHSSASAARSPRHESRNRHDLHLSRFSGIEVSISLSIAFASKRHRRRCSYMSGAIVIADGGHWLFSEPMADPDHLQQTSRKLEQSTKDIGRPTSSKM